MHNIKSSYAKLKKKYIFTIIHILTIIFSDVGMEMVILKFKVSKVIFFFDWSIILFFKHILCFSNFSSGIIVSNIDSQTLFQEIMIKYYNRRS